MSEQDTEIEINRLELELVPSLKNPAINANNRCIMNVMIWKS